MKAVLLAADPFLGPPRLPWSGGRIAMRKAGLGVPPAAVGESWEVSVDPTLPSRLAEGGGSLTALLAAQPAVWLGREAVGGGVGTSLLLKWLDAGERLSLQIHPADGDPGLAPTESGKPEAWYVVEHAPGAGLFVGFRAGVTRDAVERAARTGEGMEALLNFITVEAGDFFVIHARTPHAIGEGVFVVEPQRVIPGRTGVTYRYSDWGRRYDAAGRYAEGGAPRPLQLAEALDVTDWGAVRDGLPSGARFRAGAPDRAAPLRVEALGGPGAPCPWDALVVARAVGTGAARLPRPGTLLAVSLLDGEARIALDGDAPVTVLAGQTAIVPAAAQDAEITGEDVHAVLAAAVA